MPEENNSNPNLGLSGKADANQPKPYLGFQPTYAGKPTNQPPITESANTLSLENPSKASSVVANTPDLQTLATDKVNLQNPSPNLVASGDIMSRFEKKKWFRLKPALSVTVVTILFVASISVAYFIGKGNQKVVYRPPEPKPINLPPQAVVVAECVPGRGKQYIIPKDIPRGPIYDVVNSKVIAIEFNLSLSDIQSNPNSFSDTILKLTKEYPVDHFSIVPDTPKAGKSLENIYLIMYVVSKAEASAITCG